MNDTRMFDGTDRTAGPRFEADESPIPVDDPTTDAVGLDALDALREIVQEREAAPTPEPVRVPIPGLGWRLVCDPEFPYSKFRDWQKAGLPIKQRAGKRAPNPLDMDRAYTSCLILVNTCVAVEMQRGDGGWATVTNSHGQPVTLKDEEFLRRFNVIDPVTMLRKLFTRPGRSADAELMKAGDQVTAAAGYAEADEDGEESDPTV